MPGGWAVLCTLPFAPFAVGGVAEAVVPGASAGRTAASVGRALAAAAPGLGGFLLNENCTGLPQIVGQL